MAIKEIISSINNELKGSSEVILNIGNGTRLHSIAMWHSLLQSIPNDEVLLKACYADVYSNTIYEWSINNGEIKERIYPYSNQFTLSDLAGIYGYQIFNKDKAQVIDPKDSLNIVSNMKVQKKGDSLERQTFVAICHQLLENRFHNIKEVYFNPIITRINSKVPIAEYDVIIFTTDNKVVIVECKDGEPSIKEIEAQQKLASSWGAGFAKLVCVRNFKSIESYLSIHDNYNMKNIRLIAGDRTSEDIPANRLDNILNAALKD